MGNRRWAALLLCACAPQDPIGASRGSVTVLEYQVLPSDTDGSDQDCPGPGIGCDDPDDPLQWGELALNGAHFLALPSSSKQSGKLLLFLCGGNGNAAFCEHVYPVAAGQGYHVIGLTYPAGPVNSCGSEATQQEQLDCYGNLMSETVTGVEGPSPGGPRTDVSLHPQDAIVHRLVKVLEWAHANHPDDGWDRYLDGADVDWSRVHLAGFSNGASHASLMGTLPAYRDVARVALWAAPNDGAGGTTEETWIPATYVQHIAGVTDTRYYGLVHVLNHADADPGEPSPVYQVTKAWRTFGMEEPENPPRIHFDPDPATTTFDFGGAHMLISDDPDTTPDDGHNSVVRGTYACDDPTACPFGASIGYEPAWRCILGTGDAAFSARPVADAGPDQTLECTGNGGAIAALDGSGSADADCDVLTYAWAGPLGTTAGRTASLFVPLGSHDVTLAVSDGWSPSLPDTTRVTVVDTQPPSLQVTLTPTSLWPPNHRLVRIDATVVVSDSCGDAPPQVVLSSITSDQPDNGLGDGDTDGDVQGAELGTFDRSFLLRSERAGGDPRGRTYTVTYTATDGSGNETRTSATVHVPHSR